MVRSSFLVFALAASAALAQKPAITFKPPPPGEDDRPLITEIVAGPQGSDYAFKIEFNKLKRLIQQDIETPMARQLIKGELRDGDTATVDLKDGQIVIVPTLAPSNG